jgi:hypothetical protein
MSLWLPGANIITGSDSGPMLGGPAKVVWHTTENNPLTTTAAGVARYLQVTGNTVHLVWHPVSGEIVQMIPANRGGKGLENRPGGVQTNRAGKYVIQIEVVGRAAQPFTDRPMRNLPLIQSWLTGLGVPPVWSGTEDRSVENWGKGGHFGHMDVPENSHTDPGMVDKNLLAKGVPPPPQEDDMLSKEAQDWLIARDGANNTWITDNIRQTVGRDVDALASRLAKVEAQLAALNVKLAAK